MSHSNRFLASTAFMDTWANAAHPAVLPIPDLLRGLEAVVVGVVAADGALKDANRGFLLLMTRSMISPQTADVRDLFINPRFDDLLARRMDPFEGTLYRGLLSFGRRGGKVTSLRGTVYRYEGDYVLVAEHDIVGLEVLRGTLLEVQEDLEEKQRQIIHLEHRISRLHELANAALRDRDTLLDALARHGLSTTQD